MKVFVLSALVAFVAAQQTPPIGVNPLVADPCAVGALNHFESFQVSGIPGQSTAEFREGNEIAFVNGAPINYLANRNSDQADLDNSQQFRIAICAGINGKGQAFRVWTVTDAKADGVWDPCKGIVLQQPLSWFGDAPPSLDSPADVGTWFSTGGNVAVSFSGFTCVDTGFNDINPDDFLAISGYVQDTVANQVGLDNSVSTELARHFSHVTEAIGACATTPACASFSFFVPGFIQGSEANAIVTETPSGSGRYLVSVQPGRDLIYSQHNTIGVVSGAGAGEEVVTTAVPNGFTINVPSAKKDRDLVVRYFVKSGLNIQQSSILSGGFESNTESGIAGALAIAAGGVVCGAMVAAFVTRRKSIPLADQDAIAA